MASIDQPDNGGEDKIPPLRWAIPTGIFLVACAISAVITAVHVMAVPSP